jgi:hypothetical protein
MSIEKDYRELLGFAKKIIKDKRWQMEADELINEAYVHLVTDGQPYSLTSIKRLITRSGFKEQDAQLARISISSDDDRGEVVFGMSRIETDVPCSKCNEPKPAMCFSSYVNKSGRKITHRACIDCENKRKAEWTKKTGFKRDPEKWNAYMRMRRAKQKLAQSF